MTDAHTPLGIVPGDVVRWNASGPRIGVVKDIGTPAESAEVDEIMGRPPGASLRQFGPILRVECAEVSCTACRGGWRPGWLHSVNECQVEILPGAAPAVQVALWD